MRGVVMYSARDVRVVDREDPKIIEPTDTIIKISATCICGSDLWPYRGVEPADHQVMGHEYVGIVEEIRSLLAASDVLGTGWFAAAAADVRPGKTVAVVGDGAVGLMGVLAAKQLGAERIIAMSRHGRRQELARVYGATDIVEERGAEGVAKIKDLTDGLGAHSVIEAVGTQESTMQAINATRPGGHLGFVGLNYEVKIPGMELFFADIHIHGGPAPVRRFLPDLIQQLWDRKIDPGKVFDMSLPLEQAADGYKAMDERRAVKVMLTP
jgi:threonine dehydrogenase-like Zn-dependent dehydrogenase